MKDTARNDPSPQPCIVVHASDGKVKDSFLVIERTPFINKVLAKDILLVLLSSFFAFNVHYPEGCCKFYSLLEVQQESPS